MGESVKFSSKMDAEILEELRRHATETGRTLSGLLTEAAADLLAKARVRPAFRKAADAVIDDHAELLERLAR